MEHCQMFPTEDFSQEKLQYEITWFIQGEDCVIHLLTRNAYNMK